MKNELVYVVTQGADYEGEGILSIHTTKDAAIKFVEGKLKEKGKQACYQRMSDTFWRCFGSYFEVTEFELKK